MRLKIKQTMMFLGTVTMALTILGCTLAKGQTRASAERRVDWNRNRRKHDNSDDPGRGPSGWHEGSSVCANGPSGRSQPPSVFLRWLFERRDRTSAPRDDRGHDGHHSTDRSRRVTGEIARGWKKRCCSLRARRVWTDPRARVLSFGRLAKVHRRFKKSSPRFHQVPLR